MTDIQKKFIKDNFDHMSVESLRKLFNETFNTEYKSSVFYYHTQQLGLSKHVQHKYTAEEDQFLEENAPKMTREELTAIFNKKFDTSIDFQAITMRCWKKGFLAQSDGKFKSGSVPWEKTKGGREEYVKTIKGGNSTSFRKGIVPLNTLPIGTESEWNGETYVKTQDGWKAKRRMVYESYYGSIPKGMNIMSIDGDKHNCDISNLRIVDNNALWILMSNDWLGKGPEIFDVGVQYAKLYGLLSKDIKKANRSLRYKENKYAIES